MEIFNLHFTTLETLAITWIIFFSSCLFFSLHEFALYAMSSVSEINGTRSLIKNDTNDRSVLRWSFFPNGNTTANPELPDNNKADLQAGGTDQYKNHYTHYDNNVVSGTSNHHEDSSNSISLAQKIIKKIKQKFKAGDIPFP